MAWSNSIRRDLEALGVLDPPSDADALLSIDPALMSDEQLHAAIALVDRQRAIIARVELRERREVIEIEPRSSEDEMDARL